MMGGLPLWALAGLFVLSAAVIAFAGTRLAHVADALADRTGLGEIVAGALFVGAATSLPGAVTSVTTALQGQAGIAIGNALGGLTAQTAFLAVADICYRRANLEHAAASPAGLGQGVLLIALLTLPLLATSEPGWAVRGIHPVSVAIVLGYLAGLRLLAAIRAEPMWTPVATPDTRPELSPPNGAPGDSPDSAQDGRALWLRFGVLAGLTAVAGFVIGEVGTALVERGGLRASVVGTLFSAVANSLPELVTAVAAVRIGAVSLAVGDVIGGNAFEVMFLSLADAVTPGSIYAAFTSTDRSTGQVAILMVTVLMLGMIRRERRGIAGIGFESAMVLGLYALSVVLVLA
ncbi:sodium:calcium antiporter [Frigidibacter sp. MR17.24]|uniref:sodium:calcium antiporter n=1 Tax=Frigidibacter sp. MR17.24 TaxID=3127345 RepID=UPI00301314BC